MHVDICGLDRVEEELCNARLFDVYEVWLEEAFWCLEAFAAYADNAAVRQGVAFYKNSSFFTKALVKFEVVGDVVELLFDLADRLEVGCSVECVAPAEEEGDEVAGYVSACDV